MGEHSSSQETRPEPVAIASAVQALLAALVTLGWVQLDDTKISAIGTVVALLVAAGVTLYTRSRVTPSSKPRDAEGRPLVPDPAAPVPAATLLKREGVPRVLV